MTSVFSLRRLWRRRAGPSRPRSRGQSLVEFALILPILLLMVIGTMDVARVYLGWINLQSMTRIGANYAATNPNAWGSTPNTTVQATYRAQVVADAVASNCILPQSGGQPLVTPPTFTDVNGGGIGLGDTVTVRLTCRFQVVTPILSEVIGNSITAGAESTFPVKAGLSAVAGGGSEGGGPGTPPVSAFMGNDVIADGSTTPIISGVDDGTGFAVDFRDTSGGAPNDWAWNLGDGTTLTGVQDPGVHKYFLATCPTPNADGSCTYSVSMTASNPWGASPITATMDVQVFEATDANFSATSTSGDPPLAVTFKDLSTAGGTAFHWKFGDGNTSTSQNPSHTYGASGTYDVTLTVTYPTGDVTVIKKGFVSVLPGNCKVPHLDGIRFDNAQAAWTGAGFSGNVKRAPNANPGNFEITAQSLVASSMVNCALGVEVSGR